MSTRLYVDMRGSWFQIMDAPVESGAVLERMELLAKNALRQFVHQESVTVTAISDDDGFVRQLVRERGLSQGIRRACPHCGGFL